MLKGKQQIAYNTLISGYNTFLTGEGGTGKSYVISEFIDFCDKNNINIMITAPTGIAAINVGGVTLHRAFKIPLKPLVEDANTIPNLLKDVDVIIIDEISMTRIDVFDYISKIIIALNMYRRKAKKKDLQVVVVGDFFQLPPVITDKDRETLETYKYGENLGSGFAFQSKYWNLYNFVCINLTDVVRQNDTEFIKHLNNIRVGNRTSINYFNSIAAKNEINDAILLCGTNKAVKEKNDKEFNKLNTKIVSFEALEEGEIQESDKVVPNTLKLRVGCRVMSVINDCFDKYQNGSLGTVTKIDKEGVTVKFDNGNTVYIEPYTWDIHNYNAKKVNGKVKLQISNIGTYSQIPLKLAYAVTIHKSQGQTYDKVNLNPYCWDYGQLYVALSRVKTVEQLHLTQPIQYQFLKTSVDVKNFYNSMNKII